MKPEIEHRINELLVAINDMARQVKRLQTQGQDILLRMREDDQMELTFDNVYPITDADQ